MLNSVYEVFLFAVEHVDAEDEEDEHADETIAQRCPRELSDTVSPVLEGLYQCSHGVQKHDLMQSRVFNITERIDNRRGVHPQRDEDAEEIDQVAVFGSQRRDDKPQAQRQALHDENDDREEQQVPVRAEMHAFEDKEDIDDDKRAQLD